MVDVSVTPSHTWDDIVSLIQLTENTTQVGNLIIEEMVHLPKTSIPGCQTASGKLLFSIFILK